MTHVFVHDIQLLFDVLGTLVSEKVGVREEDSLALGNLVLDDLSDILKTKLGINNL
jgi:hypothetical protein